MYFDNVRILLQKHEALISLTDEELYIIIETNKKLKKAINEALKLKDNHIIGGLENINFDVIYERANSLGKYISNQTRNKILGSKLWREEIRPKLLEEECAWCGSTHFLEIHHPKKYPKSLSIMEHHIARVLQKTVRSDKELYDYIMLTQPLPKDIFLPIHGKKCPKCNSSKINEREIKTPKYRCNNCKEEFEEPYMALKIPSYYEVQIKYLKKHFKEIIKKVARKVISDLNEEYIKKEYTITLCSSCHYLYEIENKKLCERCKKNRHPKMFPTCEECDPEIRENEREWICRICSKPINGYQSHEIMCYYDGKINFLRELKRKEQKKISEYF